MTKREEKLKKMLEAEREKVTAYEQIAQVHCAYVGLLLKKLGAVKDKGIELHPAEVTEAMKGIEVRAVPVEGGGYSLYYADKE